MSRIVLHTLSCLFMFSLCSPISAVVPRYRITTLGYTDAEHTREDGYKLSTAWSTELNEAGQVGGLSYRYNNGTRDMGQNAWLYNGTAVTSIGFSGSEYTRSDGYQNSGVNEINSAGQARGFSQKFIGSIDAGYSAWYYDGSNTLDLGLSGGQYAYHTATDLNEAGQVVGVSGSSPRYVRGLHDSWFFDGSKVVQIGLTHGEHSRGDLRSSDAEGLNENGQVYGRSQRYSKDRELGTSAWLFDGQATKRIGLYGAEFTRDDGYQYSGAAGLSNQGIVIGGSYRFKDMSNFGTSAWLYNGTSTVEIGIMDSGHTRSDGYRSSSVAGLNETGFAYGYSERFDGDDNLGSTAWRSDGQTTEAIGLVDAEHTGERGYQEAGLMSLNMNERGDMIGTSRRFNGCNAGLDLGHSAWYFDGQTTKRIGLIGDEYTSSDGYMVSSPYAFSNSGYVAGYSYRFNQGSTQLGFSAWLFNGTETIQVGLTDGEHTSTDGSRFNLGEHLNEAGQLAGVAQLYKGGFDNGGDAWLYDPSLDQTFLLRLSSRSDGFASSSIQHLNEDGVALGTYKLFNEFDNELGDRAFYFTVDDGLHDLGSLVSGGLSANGWAALVGSISTNSFGQILGYGNLLDGSRMAFLLTPIIPEPSSLTLVLCSLLLAARVRGAFISGLFNPYLFL